MAYQRRKRCESNIYHVIIRGEGRMLIFEDDDDRQAFMKLLIASKQRSMAKVYAWCLMGNHVHLLLHADLDDISQLLQRVLRNYAKRFNDKHDHIGHLMQGRFKSIPIESDSQLMETVRYIHQNPQSAGIVRGCEYRWSSYREYLHGRILCDTGRVVGIFGGIESFMQFHEEVAATNSITLHLREEGISDVKARALVNAILANRGITSIPKGDKGLRNEILVDLKHRGVSVRQIERITGIGRNIIARAK